jgi:hypothetical protein
VPLKFVPGTNRTRVLALSVSNRDAAALGEPKASQLLPPLLAPISQTVANESSLHVARATR